MSGEEITVMVDYQEPGLKKTGIKDLDAKKAITKAFDAFHWVATKSQDAILAVGSKTDEVEVEFGIKVGSKAGVLVTQGNADAHIKVKLLWKNPHNGQSGAQ
jgi:hypothetical protein